MNNYIISVIDNKNEFRFNKVTFRLNGSTYKSINMKIDTGCAYTTIPIYRLGLFDFIIEQYKRAKASELIANIEYNIGKGYTYDEAVNLESGTTFKVSYGIESGGKKHKSINFLDIQEIMGFEAISFKHTISDLKLMCNLSGELSYIDLGEKEIFVNYDRRGNILLGMDLLSEMDIHIGTSKILNKVILLACPKDRLNKEYYRVLNDHFSLGDDILAASILS